MGLDETIKFKCEACGRILSPDDTFIEYESGKVICSKCHREALIEYAKLGANISKDLVNEEAYRYFRAGKQAGEDEQISEIVKFLRSISNELHELNKNLRRAR